MYCSKSSTVQHLFLSFKTQRERDNLYTKIIQEPGNVYLHLFHYYFKLIIFTIHLNYVFNIISAVKLEDTGQENMTLLWQNGVISNYEYLLYLNRWNILTMSLMFLFFILKFENYQSRIYKLCHKLIFRFCIISNSLM